MTARVYQLPTSHVWITQCLCPQRHCIAAMAGEAAGRAAAERDIERRLRMRVAFLLVVTRALNPWCGLCGARSDTWKFELRRTRWRTMAEALPELKELEAENPVARALLDDGPERPN
jgi:hypothetical protein